jgi:hypothetical protein
MRLAVFSINGAEKVDIRIQKNEITPNSLISSKKKWNCIKVITLRYEAMDTD